MNQEKKNKKLIWAIKRRKSDAVKQALALGADPNSCDILTTLTSFYEHEDTEIIKLLIDAGADVNKTDACGNFPLIYAVLNGHAETVKLLLRCGANVNLVNEVGGNSLHTASSYYPEIAEILLNAGAEVNVRTEHGWTALMYAAMNGSTNLVLQLVRAGAIIDDINYLGYTAMVIAALKGYTDIMEILIDAGADPNFVNKNGKTAFETLLYQHPDKYKTWMRVRQKRGLLRSEDACSPVYINQEPDFNL